MEFTENHRAHNRRAVTREPSCMKMAVYNQTIANKIQSFINYIKLNRGRTVADEHAKLSVLARFDILTYFSVRTNFQNNSRRLMCSKRVRLSMLYNTYWSFLFFFVNIVRCASINKLQFLVLSKVFFSYF